MHKTIKLYTEGWNCKCGQSIPSSPYDVSVCPSCGHKWTEGDDYWDDKVEYKLPARWVICGDCDGSGKTYLGWAASEQPALTYDDFYEEGPEFMEDYFAGRYDRTCPCCHGSGKELIIDREAIVQYDEVSGKETVLNPSLHSILVRYEDFLEEDAYYQAERDAERRMGA